MRSVPRAISAKSSSIASLAAAGEESHVAGVDPHHRHGRSAQQADAVEQRTVAAVADHDRPVADGGQALQPYSFSAGICATPSERIVSANSLFTTKSNP